MKLVIVSGSARPSSQSIRVAAWLEQRATDFTDIETIDLNQAFVPTDSNSLFDPDSDNSRRFQPLRQSMEAADAVILVCPEWHGMPPGKLISLMQSLGDSLAHKPVLLVTVSATRHGGAYPSEMLRGHAAKNTRLVWLPEYIIIRQVEAMLQDSPTGEDEYIQQRLANALRLLSIYGQALAGIRTAARDQLADYPNGM